MFAPPGIDSDTSSGESDSPPSSPDELPRRSRFTLTSLLPKPKLRRRKKAEKEESIKNGIEGQVAILEEIPVKKQVRIRLPDEPDEAADPVDTPAVTAEESTPVEAEHGDSEAIMNMLRKAVAGTRRDVVYLQEGPKSPDESPTLEADHGTIRPGPSTFVPTDQSILTDTITHPLTFHSEPSTQAAAHPSPSTMSQKFGSKLKRLVLGQRRRHSAQHCGSEQQSARSQTDQPSGLSESRQSPSMAFPGFRPGEFTHPFSARPSSYSFHDTSKRSSWPAQASLSQPLFQTALQHARPLLPAWQTRRPSSPSVQHTDQPCYEPLIGTESSSNRIPWSTPRPHTPRPPSPPHRLPSLVADGLRLKLAPAEAKSLQRSGGHNLPGSVRGQIGDTRDSASDQMREVELGKEKVNKLKKKPEGRPERIASTIEDADLRLTHVANGEREGDHTRRLRKTRRGDRAADVAGKLDESQADQAAELEHSNPHNPQVSDTKDEITVPVSQKEHQAKRYIARSSRMEGAAAEEVQRLTPMVGPRNDEDMGPAPTPPPDDGKIRAEKGKAGALPGKQVESEENRIIDSTARRLGGDSQRIDPGGTRVEDQRKVVVNEATAKSGEEDSKSRSSDVAKSMVKRGGGDMKARTDRLEVEQGSRDALPSQTRETEPQAEEVGLTNGRRAKGKFAVTHEYRKGFAFTNERTNRPQLPSQPSDRRVSKTRASQAKDGEGESGKTRGKSAESPAQAQDGSTEDQARKAINLLESPNTRELHHTQSSNTTSSDKPLTWARCLSSLSECIGTPLLFSSEILFLTSCRSS